MIRRDHVEISADQRAPQLFPLCRLPDWWSAFELHCTVRNLLARKREVVRTRFDRDRKSSAAGIVERRDGAAGGEMDDVDASAVVAGKRDQEIDRRDLRA